MERWMPSNFLSIRRRAREAANRARLRVAGRPGVRRALSGAMKGAGAGIAYGVFVEPRWLERTQVHVPIRGLPRVMEDYRVLHLSDIHHNLLSGERFLQGVIETANALDVDLVALTGDFITHDPGRMAPCLRHLGAIRAADGIVAVRGNHDARVPLREMERLMDRSGIRLLENRHEVLRPARHRSAAAGTGHAAPAGVTLAGVGDTWTAPCLPGEALRGADPDLPAILLSHNPAAVRLLPDGARVDLVLSGHTHGGQVRPFHREVPLLAGGESRHVCGLSRHGETSVYVSRGVGTSAMHFRWNCRPEIALIVLRTPGAGR